MLRPMKIRRRLRLLCMGIGLLSLYPAFVLIFTWSHVMHADFEGGRNGPLDAYRHALASATVSHTMGEWAVVLVSMVGEMGGKDTNRMDRHNNRIGALIGKRVTSFRELEPAVRTAVEQGKANATEKERITWLPRSRWDAERLW